MAANVVAWSVNSRELIWATGEIVEKNQARQIYHSIVNRSRDPGRLEYLGGEVFRANIFPIAAAANERSVTRSSIVAVVSPLECQWAAYHATDAIIAAARNLAPIAQPQVSPDGRRLCFIR